MSNKRLKINHTGKKKGHSSIITRTPFIQRRFNRLPPPPAFIEREKKMRLLSCLYADQQSGCQKWVYKMGFYAEEK